MLKLGQTVGNYVLVERLGGGGMGEVWIARHAQLDRPSALKVILPAAVGADPAALEASHKRFFREAQMMSRLTSPHTVQVYDFGTTDDGSFFYAMELLDGVDLDQLVTRFGPVPSERAVHLLLQGCESLSEAHRELLIHRDIKPANLFAGRVGTQVDFVKVLDFGLVKHMAGATDSKLTTEGASLGSPAFIAPEAAMGEAIDARTDVYALGCVAYWLVSGKLVFDETSAMAMMFAHIQKPAVPLSEVSEVAVPPALEALVMACLAKKPADRPQTIEALADGLRAVPLAEPWTPERAAHWWTRHVPAARPVPAAPVTPTASSATATQSAGHTLDTSATTTAPPAAASRSDADAAHRTGLPALVGVVAVAVALFAVARPAGEPFMPALVGDWITALAALWLGAVSVALAVAHVFVAKRNSWPAVGLPAAAAAWHTLVAVAAAILGLPNAPFWAW